jgi:zinc protease
MNKPLSTVVVCLALVAAPATAQNAPEIQFERFELPNGLDVILHEDHSIPMVTVNVWYHVGSGDEKPGRTGFAHLFEHMMFQGSKNHDDDFFKPLQKVGGLINGSTNTDRTNYWENVPSNYLETVLWLEADRMGFLLPAMTQEKLDNQRDVVKNERRQNYENQPYNKARLILAEMMYPDEHPYSWPTIGSQEDLSAASMEDVSEFFKTYYAPNNTSLVIAGDIDPAQTKAWVEKYFAAIPPGPAVERVGTWMPELDGPRRAVAEDNVELPRLYYAWHTPGFYKPGDAEFDLLRNILVAGKSSRLYRSLVYEQEIAQDVAAQQASRLMGSLFHVRVTAREGYTLEELEEVVAAELAKLLEEGVTDDELQQARVFWEASFIRNLERVGGFGGVADQLNNYNYYLGEPGGFGWDMDRYSSATAEGVLSFARRYLRPEKRGTLHIVPQGQLAAKKDDTDRTAQPQGAAEPGFTPPAIHRERLANGLELLVVEDHSLPIVQANLVVKSGWAADPADRPGTASLTAELLDEGTANRDALEISDEAKRLAAALGTNSFFDGSGVNLNVLKRNLAPALDLMADVVMNPTFPEEELERQRRIYLGRIQQETKQPQAAAFKSFLRLLYGAEHPYGQPFTGSGTTAAVQAIERADLVGYYDSQYLPGNAALMMVGDVTPAEARQAATTAFGGWQGGAARASKAPAAEPVSGTTVYIVDKPGAPQSVIVAGNVAIRRSDPDYVAFEVMNNAFGGKFASRINLNLREDKGYSYGARAIFIPTRGDGPFLVFAPVQSQSTKESVVEIVKELRELVGSRPITDEELAEAQGNLIKGYPQQFETVGGVAVQLSEMIRYGLSDDEWVRRLESIEKVTAMDATKAVSDRLDPENLLIVVVGDREQIEPGLRELGLGEVKTFDMSVLQ